MKIVNHAKFIQGGTAVVTVVSNRVEAHDLRADNSGDLVPTLRWQAKMTYCIHIHEAAQSGVVICTDTNGRHMAVDTKTGLERWRSKKSSEGHSGVVIPDPTGRGPEAFLFITWAGAVQMLNPATGETLDKIAPFPFLVRRLHQDKRGGLSLQRTDRPVQNDQLQDKALCRLTIAPWGLTDIMSLVGTDVALVSPDGTHLLRVKLVVPDRADTSTRHEHWQIVDIMSGRVLANRKMPPEQFSRFKTGWSPDGSRLWTLHKDIIMLLKSEDLKTEAEVPSAPYRLPAFHPKGTHLLVCDGRRTRIAQIQSLLG